MLPKCDSISQVACLTVATGVPHELYFGEPEETFFGIDLRGQCQMETSDVVQRVAKTPPFALLNPARWTFQEFGKFAVQWRETYRRQRRWRQCRRRYSHYCQKR